MIALIQRVSFAQVEIEQSVISSIHAGLVALVAIQPTDGEIQVQRMAERLLGYRIFNDENGRMNCSLRDSGGQLLLVSQFTLAANTAAGMRPSFSSAASPEHAKYWFERLVEWTRQLYTKVETGRFGANMRIHLINDGPVTFWLEAP